LASHYLFISLSGSDNNEEYKGLKWKVYNTQIRQKIFAKTGIETE